MHELQLGDTVQSRGIHVCEELVDILNTRLDLHGLHGLYELLLGKRRGDVACVTTEDIEKSLKRNLVLVLDRQDLSAGRGQDRVDETALEEGHVDATAGHEVDEVLVSDLELVFISHAHVFDYTLSLLLGQDDLQAGKVLDYASRCDILNLRDVSLLFSLAALGGLMRVEYVFESHVFMLKALLDLLIYLVDLLTEQDRYAFEVFRCRLHQIVSRGQKAGVGLIRPHGKVRDVTHLIDHDLSTAIAINDVVHLLEILLGE